MKGSDGVDYAIDDHVYVSLPYSKRAGEPYLVARIQEFIRPKTGEASSTTGRVKLAFYLRPRDVTTRYVADHRVLYATMHSDVSPMSYIRGKCRVLHRDRLPCDIETYKREPDSFYYHQLYDRYLHRYFDIIPTDRIRNAPAEPLAYLNEHYEYICCEVGMQNELCDALRGCVECHKWAANSESVLCAICRKIWHLQCLDPPLPRKPTAGYGWSCANCSQKHEENVEKYIAGNAIVKPGAVTKAPLSGRSGRGRLDTPTLESRPRTPTDKLRSTNGWPFRYFGQHTDPTTITDPHDSIYPRASTRIGQKFQVPMSLLDPEAAKEEKTTKRGWNLQVGDKRSRGGQSLGKGKQSAEYERGGAETIDVVCLPPRTAEGETQLESLIASAHVSDLYKDGGVNLLDKALTLFQSHEGDGEASLKALERLHLRDLGMVEWSEAEIEKFNEGLEEMQDDLEEIARTLPRKTTADVVHFFYVSRPDLQNALDEQHDDDKFADGVATSSIAKDVEAPPVVAIDAESRAGTPELPAKLGPCAICGEQKPTKESWYKCPSGIGESHYRSGEKVLCQECSIQWRHYGSDKTKAEEEAKPSKAARKAAEQKAKAAANGKAAIDGPPLPPPPPPKPVAVPKPCVMCKRMEPKTKLVTCQRCTLSGHYECCGISVAIDIDEWLCPMCEGWNILRRPPVNGRCSLCPPRVLKPSKEDPLNALDYLKMTTEFGYLHLPCAIVHSEVTFNRPLLMEEPEGASAVPTAKWAKKCFVCNQKDAGACVKCADCPKQFHVSCAWSSNFKFAFEISPVKKKKQVQQISVTFKTESGALEPKIWCKSHRLKPDRIVYDFQEKDPDTKLTALQTYVRNYKTSRPPDSFPLIRRAMRLDAILTPALKPPPPPPRSPSPLLVRSAVSALEMDLEGGPPPVAKPPPKPREPKAAPSRPSSKSKSRSKPKSKTKGKAKAAPRPAPYVYNYAPAAYDPYDDYDDETSFEANDGPSYVPPAPASALPKIMIKARTSSANSPARTSKAQPAYGDFALPPFADPSLASPAPTSHAPSLPPFASRNPDPSPPKPPTPRTSAPPPFNGRAGEPSLPSAAAAPPRLPPPPVINGPPTLPRPTLDQHMASRPSGALNGHKTPASKPLPMYESDMYATATPRAPGANHRTGPKPIRPIDPICYNCGVDHTPCWRRDREDNMLCNACGQYYKAHGHHKPLANRPARPATSARPASPADARLSLAAHSQRTFAGQQRPDSPPAMSFGAQDHPMLHYDQLALDIVQPADANGYDYDVLGGEGGDDSAYSSFYLDAGGDQQMEDVQSAEVADSGYEPEYPVSVVEVDPNLLALDAPAPAAASTVAQLGFALDPALFG